MKETKGDFVIKISPENLALTYVSNSNILNYFSELGVNLDPFFKLLWRHVLTVELLDHHFSLHSKSKKKSLIQRLSELFSGNSPNDIKMREAISYLNEWETTFWKETEYRVKEITQKVEKELSTAAKANLGVSKAKIGLLIQGIKKLSEEQKTELKSRGQEIISAAQIQDLHKVMNLLDNVLEDRQKQYFLLIDGLDENWVEEKLRYKLIMALVVTAKDFIKVKNANILIAIRRDLIDRVFRLTRGSGFQEEKFQSLYIPLKWSKEDLIELLDKRVRTLVSRRYTKQIVTHRDLLPKQFQKKMITDYIFERAERPRDIISLFNICILYGTKLSRLGGKEFKEAEGEYSRMRLRALGDEWGADYSSLLDFCDILKQRTFSFKISSITDKEIEELCLRICAYHPNRECALQSYAMQVVDCIVSPHDFKIFLMQIFYKTGLIGLKTEAHESEFWVNEVGRSFSTAEVTPNTSVVIHPTYHRALGIKPLLR